MPDVITLHKNAWKTMVQHAVACLPQEGCGLLGGVYHSCRVAIPVTNSLQSSTEFRMEPKEQLAAMLKIEELGYELIGIFHSHPNGPTHPSEKDVLGHLYPGVFTMILSPKNDRWSLNIFNIQNGQYSEVRGNIIR